MFLKGNAKLILPLRWEYRRAAHLGLCAFLNDPLVHLCGGEIEYKEILAISPDELTQNFVSVVWIPAHHIEQLHEEDLARHLTRLAFAATVGTPLKRMQIRFETWPDSQLPRLAVDQKLNVIDLRQALDACRVQTDLVVVEGDGRFADVRKEFNGEQPETYPD